MIFSLKKLILYRINLKKFRSRFTLNEKERKYLIDKGLDKIIEHATDFINQRLAPAFPKNDGKQTPWKGHPVFIAQHATATCCRSCLEKWYKIQKGQALTQTEKDFILDLIKAWIKKDYQTHQSVKKHS